MASFTSSIRAISFLWKSSFRFVARNANAAWSSRKLDKRLLHHSLIYLDRVCQFPDRYLLVDRVSAANISRAQDNSCAITACPSGVGSIGRAVQLHLRIHKFATYREQPLAYR